MANDERVREFLDRPISGDWPCLWLDATYLKVRQCGRIVSVAAIIAMAVNTDGRREIVGLCVRSVRGGDLLDRVPAEPEEPRAAGREAGVLRRAHRPRGRDRAGVRCDLAKVPGSLDQERARPFPKGQHTVVAAAIRQAFNQPDKKTAVETWRHVPDQLRARWAKLPA